MRTPHVNIAQNTENFDKWLDDLSTTDAPQCKNSLSRQVRLSHGPPVVGYCCLGRGEVVRGATIEGEETTDTALATREFIDWLGIDMSDHDMDHHHMDNPEDGCLCTFDLMTPAFPHALGAGQQMQRNEPESAAGMNDEGFTFPQIADVFRYFGIERVTMG